MARTHKKVRVLPKGKQKHTAASAAKGVEDATRILEGRWKLVILFHLFGGNVRRFSELRRAVPAVSEKMLTQQLRQMERGSSRAALRSSSGVRRQAASGPRPLVRTAAAALAHVPGRRSQH